MKKIITALLSFAFIGSAIAQTVANPIPATPTKWEKNHPRRVEVNSRLANQQKRITAERKSGEITKAQATTLRTEDKQIRTEEKSMASQNNGHITKTEKKALNQQENAVSKKIGK